MNQTSRPTLTALVSGIAIAALSVSGAAADHIAGGMQGADPARVASETQAETEPAAVFEAGYIVQTDYPFNTAPIDVEAEEVSQSGYVPISNDPYNTGDAYSTGTSPKARGAWQP